MSILAESPFGQSWSRAFIHSHIQLLLTEHLLCARYHFRFWETSVQQEKQISSLPHGVTSMVCETISRKLVSECEKSPKKETRTVRVSGGERGGGGGGEIDSQRRKQTQGECWCGPSSPLLPHVPKWSVFQSTLWIHQLGGACSECRGMKKDIPRMAGLSLCGVVQHLVMRSRKLSGAHPDVDVPLKKQVCHHLIDDRLGKAGCQVFSLGWREERVLPWRGLCFKAQSSFQLALSC